MKRNHNISFLMPAVHRRAAGIRRAVRSLLCSLLAGISLLATSCIEPPLHLPGEEVMVDLPIVLTDMEVVWNVDVDWNADWHYGWDVKDQELWGDLTYPIPSNYEVRRYYLGEQPRVPHTEVDGFTIFDTHFRRYYNFGYYDMLIWSNIDSDDGTQVVVINEDNLDEVTATTTGTRGMAYIASKVNEVNKSAMTGLLNQPEIFYSAYPQDIFISRNFEDYDYYDEAENVWVKKINATLTPLVYIYLVQIIIYNNDGRVVGVNGNNAISSMASTTSVNTGHTSNSPCMVYFQSRMKKDLDVKGRKADVIGGRLTTFGLCDMEPYTRASGARYEGSRSELNNYLYFDLKFINGSEKTFEVDVTEQCQNQAHGGIITVELDARDLDIPSGGEEGSGSLFVPTVEDYDEVIWEIGL